MKEPMCSATVSQKPTSAQVRCLQLASQGMVLRCHSGTLEVCHERGWIEYDRYHCYILAPAGRAALAAAEREEKP